MGDTKAFKGIIELRYRLLPYLYESYLNACNNDDMMIKHGYRIIQNTMPKCREGFFQKMIGWDDDGRRLTPRFTEIPISMQEGE